LDFPDNLFSNSLRQYHFAVALFEMLIEQTDLWRH
jgi:hypothetical protein